MVVVAFDMLQYTFYSIIFFFKGCRMTNRYWSINSDVQKNTFQASFQTSLQSAEEYSLTPNLSVNQEYLYRNKVKLIIRKRHKLFIVCSIKRDFSTILQKISIFQLWANTSEDSVDKLRSLIKSWRFYWSNSTGVEEHANCSSSSLTAVSSL